MLPNLGQAFLIAAIVLAGLQFLVGLAAGARPDRLPKSLTKNTALAQVGCLVSAYGLLTWAFISNDFSVAYVAANSNAELPLPYRIAAVWGENEGSLLLWSLLLGGWTLALALFARDWPAPLWTRTLAILGLLNGTMLLLTLVTGDPFARVWPVPATGTTLNPILQDPAMASHPPLLYAGYTGLAVPFGIAMAYLCGDRNDRRWAALARQWTLLPWAYYERGLPKRIACDNGSKFAGGQMDLWAYSNQVQMDFSRRGKPTDNVIVESFNGKFREECLNAHWFESIEDAKEKIDARSWDYNEQRPHRSLKGLTPREYAVKMST